MRIVRLNKELPLPEYQTTHSVGFDLYASVDTQIVIKPGERVLVPNGIQVEVPFGWEMQLRPRSGIALKHGVTVLNAPGTIDSDFGGEVCTLLINHGTEDFVIQKGDRISQGVLNKTAYSPIIESDEISETARGDSGWGSTGVQ